MKALTLIVVTMVVALAAAWGAGSVSADNGPHKMGDGTAAATDRCAGCHRAHTAKGKDFLFVNGAESITAFCLTCHNGVQADTNVRDGELMTTRGDPGVTAPFVGLIAGGFEWAWLDTQDPGFENIGVLGVPGRPAGPQPVTSRHSVGGTGLTAWGNGAISATANPGYAPFSLQCTSCHDPHGNGNYRILRPLPADEGGATDRTPAGVNILDEPLKQYYTQNYFGTGKGNLSAWCAQCHSRYYTQITTDYKPQQVDSGDAIFKYRHVTANTGVACVSCHTSHGTNSVPTPAGYSAQVPWPGDTPWSADPDLAHSANTRLLKMDNRGVCIKCHTDK